MVTELRRIEQIVTKARRRLVLNSILANVGYGLVVGLASGLIWLLAEPWLVESRPDWLRWVVLGSLTGLSVVIAVVFSILRATTRSQAALEVDSRFNLFERVTTVMGLPASELSSSAGQAVLGDAASKVARIKVSARFPIRPRKSSALVPVLGLMIGVAAVLYEPDTSFADEQSEGSGMKKQSDQAKFASRKSNPGLPFTKQKPPEQRERAGKSKALQELEKELDKLMEKWAKEPPETDAKNREKAADLTAMEEKLKKFEKDKAARLEQLESKLGKLDSLSQDKEFADGPADKLNDALAKGDLKKAEQEVDELRKKAKEKKLDKQELEKLDKQLKKMKDEAERLARNQDEQEKLKEKLDKAKKEGRDKDAESLQRELENIQQQCDKCKEQMDKLSEKMGEMQKAAQSGDLEKLAEELEAMKGQIEGIENELKDIEEADEYLQRVKEELKKACKACEGGGNGEGNPGESDGGRGYVKGASGRRGENKDAKTSSSDERIRGLFDPKGKKSYGGSTKGQAFTKKSNVEMGNEIRKAVQEATSGIDQQGVPRDAKAAVKEYMERIGGHK